MKIFDWMQRRFHPGALKDGLARNVKKSEPVMNYADKQALLKQVALVDVLEGWNNGILTIGTFGIDPLKPFDQQNEYFVLESERDEQEKEEDGNYNVDEDKEKEDEKYSVNSNDNEDDDPNSKEKEEEDPLMFTKFEHKFGEDYGSTTDHTIERKSTCLDRSDFERKRKGERITLAELFLADSDMDKKIGSPENEVKSGKKPPVRRKNTLSFAKKLIPHVGDDSSPIKKFNQLMKRALKRKIHPDLQGKGNESDNQNKTIIAEIHIKRTSESISLLPTLPGLTI